MLIQIFSLLLLTGGARAATENFDCKRLDDEVESLAPSQPSGKTGHLDDTKLSRALKLYAVLEDLRAKAATAIDIPGPFADRFLLQSKVLSSQCVGVRLKLSKILIKTDDLKADQILLARRQVDQSLRSQQPLSLLDLAVTIIIAGHLHSEPKIQKLRGELKKEQIELDKKYGPTYLKFEKDYPPDLLAGPKNLRLFSGVKALEESWNEEQRFCRLTYSRLQELLQNSKIDPDEQLLKSL